jgi:hypothetical protein
MCGFCNVSLCVDGDFIMCVYVGVLVISVLVFNVCCSVCTVFFVLFRLCILFPFWLYWCKNCCH